jgi:hypothetical protein
MIFFDASEVFALLLSCPTLNQDFFLTAQRIRLLHHKQCPMLVTSTQVVATERHNGLLLFLLPF